MTHQPSNPPENRKDLLPFIILAVLSLIWGSSFILMKRGLEVFAPMQVAALRIAISGVVLFPFAVWGLKSLDKRHLPYLLLCGALGNGIPAILFSTAQRYINSSTSALLNSLTPLSTLLIGVLVFRVVVERAQVLGVLIGFVGATLLVVAARGETMTTEASWYAMLPVAATVCYGLNANIISRLLKGIPPMTINSIAVSGVTIFFFLPYLIWSGFFTEALPQAQSHPMFSVAILSIIGLSVLGTALSNALFTHLIQISSPVFSSSVTYLIPIVAMVWGVLDGEHLTALHYIGIVVILAGIYLVNKRK
ncbi:MAG: DMT family transporter [Candidatus Kapaibacteriota bacterium]